MTSRLWPRTRNVFGSLPARHLSPAVGSVVHEAHPGSTASFLFSHAASWAFILLCSPVYGHVWLVRGLRGQRGLDEVALAKCYNHLGPPAGAGGALSLCALQQVVPQEARRSQNRVYWGSRLSPFGIVISVQSLSGFFFFPSLLML